MHFGWKQNPALYVHLLLESTYVGTESVKNTPQLHRQAHTPRVISVATYTQEQFNANIPRNKMTTIVSTLMHSYKLPELSSEING